MFNFHDYDKEIIAIGRENDVDLGVAQDMFVANMNKGGPIAGQPWYGGSDELDYRILHAKWTALTLTEQTEAKNAWDWRECVGKG